MSKGLQAAGGGSRRWTGLLYRRRQWIVMLALCAVGGGLLVWAIPDWQEGHAAIGAPRVLIRDAMDNQFIDNDGSQFLIMGKGDNTLAFDTLTGQSTSLDMDALKGGNRSMPLKFDNGHGIGTGGIVNLTTGSVERVTWPTGFRGLVLDWPLLYGKYHEDPVVMDLRLPHSPLTPLAPGRLQQLVEDHAASGVNRWQFLDAVDQGVLVSIELRMPGDAGVVSVVDVWDPESGATQPLDGLPGDANHRVAQATDPESGEKLLLVMATHQSLTRIHAYHQGGDWTPAWVASSGIPAKAIITDFAANGNQWVIRFVVLESFFHLQPSLVFGDASGVVQGQHGLAKDPLFRSDTWELMVSGNEIVYRDGNKIVASQPGRTSLDGLAGIITGSSIIVIGLAWVPASSWWLHRRGLGGLRRCLHCGARREEGIEFCRHCGWRTEGEDAKANPVKKKWEYEW